MKNFSFNLSDFDIETSLFCLSLFPTLGVESTSIKARENAELCRSLSRTLLLNETEMSSNEVRILYGSLTALPFVLNRDYPVDETILEKCRFYSSNAERMAAELEPVISYHMKRNK